MAPIIYPPSLLSADQVLQHAYDDATQTLRTTATAVIVGQPITVDITHTDDSVRLGDGTNFLTSTTVGPDVGLDVNIINSTLAMDITHLNDSVRLGDGTNFLTSTTIGPDVGLDVNVINPFLTTDLTASTPLIFNVSAPVAGTEYSQALPIGTKRFVAKVRSGLAKMQYAYIPGDSGSVYMSVPMGGVVDEQSLKTTGAVSFYFQTNKAAQTLEITAWT